MPSKGQPITGGGFSTGHLIFVLAILALGGIGATLLAVAYR